MRKIFIFIILLTLPLFDQNNSPSPFGVNAHNYGNEVLAKIRDGNIKWIRIDINWMFIEKQKGVFDWAEVDRVVDFAHTNDLSILAVIGYTPEWANHGLGYNHPPNNIFDWENFVTLTVLRYQDRVKYWTVWNEPNVKEFYHEGKQSYLDKILLPAAHVIKRADHHGKIVGPDLAHLVTPPQQWYEWLRFLLSEASDVFAVISHHIYKNQGAAHIYSLFENGEESYPAILTIIIETGNLVKPLWITETGWNTYDFTEPQQAEKYQQMLALMETKGYPAKIFFYTMVDPADPSAKPWGLLRRDLTEKPAYQVYINHIAGFPQYFTGRNISRVNRYIQSR